MNRAEHLAWCKTRALEYCDKGDAFNAWASMLSDLSKHVETANHPAIETGTLLIVAGELKTPDAMRKFIEDFR